jgi:hypothetical protein
MTAVGFAGNLCAQAREARGAPLACVVIHRVPRHGSRRRCAPHRAVRIAR